MAGLLACRCQLRLAALRGLSSMGAVAAGISALASARFTKEDAACWCWLQSPDGCQRDERPFESGQQQDAAIASDCCARAARRIPSIFRISSGLVPTLHCDRARAVLAWPLAAPQLGSAFRLGLRRSPTVIALSLRFSRKQASDSVGRSSVSALPQLPAAAAATTAKGHCRHSVSTSSILRCAGSRPALSVTSSGSLSLSLSPTFPLCPCCSADAPGSAQSQKALSVSHSVSQPLCLDFGPFYSTRKHHPFFRPSSPVSRTDHPRFHVFSFHPAFPSTTPTTRTIAPLMFSSVLASRRL